MDSVEIVGYEYKNVEEAAQAFYDELVARVKANGITEDDGVFETQENLRQEIREFHNDVSDEEFERFFSKVDETVAMLPPIL